MPCGKKSAFRGKAEPYAYRAGVAAVSAISAEGFRPSMRGRGVRALLARRPACGACTGTK